MAPNSGGLLQRFGLLIGAVGVAGAVLAFVADRSSVGPDDPYWDALREVGGAIVSGAVLAGLVVWFEDRREDERVGRENRRDDTRFEREEARENTAARRAWRREIDIRLISIVRTDLMAGRLDVLEDFDAETRPRSVSAALSSATTDPPRGRSFGQAIDEVDSLLEFLRQEELSEAWENWYEAYNTLADVPQPPTQPPASRSATDSLTAMASIPAQRDAQSHSIALAAETTAWVAFLAAINLYVEANYPVS